MWYYDSKVIKTPKTMVIGDITYPASIFNDSDTLTSLGIKPYREIVSDSRYYTRGSYSVNTSGSEVVGTYAGVAKDLASLRAAMLEKTENYAAALHTDIDWYWIRASKSGGASVPSTIATYSAALYSEHETKKTQIAALNTIAKIIEYESRAYTETRKQEVYNEDGSFKEYHASNTYTRALKINMCEHFSVHPDKTDAGQVSLTAD